MTNYFEGIKTLQGVMWKAVINRDKLNDGDFKVQFDDAWSKWRTYQTGKYGAYTAEPAVTPTYFLEVLDVINRIERLPIYTDGKKSGRVKLEVNYSKSAKGTWRVTVGGDTKLVKQYLKDMKFRWDNDAKVWWNCFKGESVIPKLEKSVKVKTEPKEEPKEEPKQEPKQEKAEKPKKAKKAAKAKAKKEEPKARKVEGDEAKKAMAEYMEKARAKREARERMKRTLSNW